MTGKLLLAAGLAAGLLAAQAFAQPAEARRGGFYHFGGHRLHVAHAHPRLVFHRHVIHRHRPFFFVGTPLYGYGYGYRYAYPAYGSYSYSGGCGWLYWKARETGSGYWWQRYRLCQIG